jgi:hypothetical protein
LSVAVLCEKVLQEKDAVLSLIRIVDRFTVTISGPTPPEEMPTVPISLTLVLSFKAGFARGTFVVSVRGEKPSGELTPETKIPVLFEGDERGPNVMIAVNLQANEEGLYWFDVFLEGARVTRVPLRLIYQRVTQTS